MTGIPSLDLIEQRRIERSRPAWPHQIECRARMKGLEAFYSAMEPRCGKTRPILEEAVELFQEGIIDSILIIAMPSGAPKNWIDDECPIWIPENINWLGHLWQANKVKLKRTEAALASLLTHPGLSILAVNGEAVITEAFKKYVTKFLAKRKVYCVGDEMTLLAKTPGAKRTKAMYGIAGKTVIRRALDGTPVGEGPMDLYSQYTWLDPNILGFNNFYSFRNRYAVMETGHNWATGQDYPTIKINEETGEKEYQNLDELQKKIDPYTFRARFKEVFKNVPDPVYSKNYFDLHPLQRKAYDELKEEYETELQGIGEVTAAHVLTRYLRLQQITSGYWPAQKKQPSICDHCSGDGCHQCNDLGVLLSSTPLTRIIPFKDNPRLEALRDDIMRSPGPAIVWARFDQDIDDVMELLRQMGRKPVQYDGRVDQEQKYKNKELFQTRQATDFVGKTRACGRALRVDVAENMHYYSNEFSLLQRLQSEMRTQTGDRRIATGINDLIASNTLDDELLIPALRSKRKMADLINQDKANGRWL